MVFPLVQCYYVNPVAHYLSCLGQNQDSQSMTSTSCSNPCQLLPALYSKAEDNAFVLQCPTALLVIEQYIPRRCDTVARLATEGLLVWSTPGLDDCNHQHPYAQNKQAGAGFPP